MCVSEHRYSIAGKIGANDCTGRCDECVEVLCFGL